jgi:perosamine synthetase
VTQIPSTERAVPLAQPNLTDRERDLVADVLGGDVLSMGPYTERFEEAVATLAGRRYGVACSSGTAGLHMAVISLGIGEGDEVITTPFSFVASSNAMLYERAVPVFVDIEEETLGLDPERVEDAITARTRALLPVDVFGHPCRIDDLGAIASARGLAVIEDSCEALGSSLDGRPLGSFGEVSVFAFYPNKQITTGEGGMLVTDDPRLAGTARSLRNQGRDEDGTWLRHVRLGYNYRIDELSAALGLAQLERLGELRSGRDRVAAAYGRLLEPHEWVRPPSVAPGAEVDWFVYVVRLDEEIDRDRLIGQLAGAGVPARPYFSPIHLQPLYRDRFGFAEGDFPITERVARRTLALPFSSRLAEDQVARVVEALVDAVHEQGVA